MSSFRRPLKATIKSHIPAFKMDFSLFASNGEVSINWTKSANCSQCCSGSSCCVRLILSVLEFVFLQLLFFPVFLLLFRWLCRVLLLKPFLPSVPLWSSDTAKYFLQCIFILIETKGYTFCIIAQIAVQMRTRGLLHSFSSRRFGWYSSSSVCQLLFYKQF